MPASSSLEPFVSAADVEATERRMAALTPSEAQKRQRASGKFQEELVGFVLGFSDNMTPDAISLGLFGMLAVFDMFQQSRVRDIKKVRESTILRHWHRWRGVVAEVPAGGHPLEHLTVGTLGSAEPHVLGYLVRLVTELDPEDPIRLSPEEASHLLAVLGTVTDALHDASRA